MNRQTAQILRVVFAVVGSLAFLLGIGAITLMWVFYQSNTFKRFWWGSLLYFGIGGACAYAFVRLKHRPRSG